LEHRRENRLGYRRCSKTNHMNGRYGHLPLGPDPVVRLWH
jgi:hypothetical protein